MTSTWVDFWNRDTSIYVSDRHKALHYRGVARDIAALVPGAGAHVLDHGSGEATSAHIVAARCARLWLCDAAPNTRAKIAEQFKDNLKIAAIAPEDLHRIPDESLDLIVANSVLQYLDSAMLDASLEIWREKLKPEGRLILADVIPPDVSPLTDAAALLSFAREGGFLGAAVVGLARTFFSDYRRLRGELGLSMHSEAEILDRLADAGFTGKRMARNIGHNPARMSFEARKTG
jgi:SAM-dependent methyltransferase